MTVTSTSLAEAAFPTCAPLSPNEGLRLEALRSYGILDTPREAAFDDITQLAAMICNAPMALISLVDKDRQWFKSNVGLGAEQTPLDASICAHTILQDEVFVVNDTLGDPRFIHNPLVSGDPHLRFYAGAVLRTPDGLALGSMCVLDTVPRQLAPQQLQALTALARQAMAQMELRRMLTLAQEANRYRARLMAIAGHDLKTPLRTAGYAIDKVRRKVDAETAAQLEPARDALSQIGREFDQLASLSVAGGDFAKPDLVDFPLQDVLNAIMSTWRRPAELRGLRLRMVPTSLRVRSHRTLLSTLLGNLLGNAVKYTHTGKVLLGCRRRGDQVVVEIIDTGVGMDAEDAREIFNAFRQANTQQDGLGLGLWIVNRTAQTLGYPVHVSTRKGHGSRFSVTLPLT
ncbi:MAG: GAF domain-containing sensor histidine kinase [Pseudoxanthomonas sp.]